MIHCAALSKSYYLANREIPALRGVDLSISTAGFYAIMGQSGSGKSTLLHLLASLDRPDSGTITIAGRSVEKLTDKEATEFRRREIGIVFQQFNLIPTLTALENVELPGLLAGEDKRTRALELLEQLGLSDRAEHRPDSMSGGEQQRVAIARSLLFSPPVIFADEPTGNLDSANSAKLWALLADLAKKQKITVVMVTHEPAAAAFTDEVFVLADGKFKTSFKTENLDASGVAARYQECIRTA